jgi:hypothetical protein
MKVSIQYLAEMAISSKQSVPSFSHGSSFKKMKMNCTTDSSIKVVSQKISSMIQMLISEYWLMMFSAALTYLLAVIVPIETTIVAHRIWMMN